MSWKITDLSYVSLAVPNLEVTVADYKRVFGLDETTPVTVNRPYGWLRVILGTGAECFQEILQPTNDTLPLARFVRDKGAGIYVTSFVIDDVAAAARDLQAKGVRIATGPEGARPDRVHAVWIHPRATTGVYIELTEHLLERTVPSPASDLKPEPVLKNVSYLAAVVRDLDAATKLYQNILGLEIIRGPFKNEEFGYDGAMLGLDGRGYMELQHPYDDNNAMGRFLKNRGEGPYFASFIVDDPKKSVELIKARGGNAFLEANGRIGWVHPKTGNGQMMELIPQHL